MYLFKRGAIYQLEFFDEQENRIKRVSTKSKTKPEALKFLTDFKGQLSCKHSFKYISLNQFRDEYLEYVSTCLTKNYHKSINVSFHFLFDKINKDTPLIRLSAKDLEKLLSIKFQTNPHVALAHYRNLKSAFGKAVKWNYLTSNPLKSFRLPKPPQLHPLFIGKDELDLILNNEPNNNLKDFYSFGFYTGMRLSEIINLRWCSIDLQQREIKVQNTKEFTTKNKKDRIIPINDTLYQILSERLPKIISINESEYVFSNAAGFRYSPFYISKKFKRAVREAKFNDKIHFHSLRHSFISNLIQRGCSIYVAKELAGHSQISVTEIYAHLRPENLRNAIELLN